MLQCYFKHLTIFALLYCLLTLLDNEHKRLFYEKYNVLHQKKIGRTKELTQAQYNKILYIKQYYCSMTTEQRTKTIRNLNNRYELRGNVKDNCLVRKFKGKLLPCATLESFFDIIDKIHKKLGHAKERKTIKMVQKQWYGISNFAVKAYMSLCPQCNQVARNTKKMKMRPLKFILSKQVGARAQVDLIDMRSQPDPVTNHKWILRYADHLSAFSHVRCLKSKASVEVAQALIEIISSAIIPKILQSDNGSEFLGECVKAIQENFPVTQLVKGRPRHPQSQGLIERGNGPFKDALQDWMRENKTNCWHRGAYVVNLQLNQRPHEARDNLTPYEMMYALKDEVSMEAILGPSARHVNTELGWIVLSGVLRHMKVRHPDVLLNDEMIQLLAEQGDQLQALEEGMSLEEREIYDMDSRMQEVIRYCLLDICKVNPVVIPYLSDDASISEESNEVADEAGSEEEESDNIGEEEEEKEKIDEDEVGEEHRAGTRMQYRQQLNKKASAAQEKQAVTVNRRRGHDYKEVLDENDVCLVSVHHRVRGATDKKSFAVMITKVIPRTNRATNVTTYRYRCLTVAGYLKTNMDRTALDYKPQLTGALMGIDRSTADDSSSLTIEQANIKINHLGGAKERPKVTSCRCQTDCSKNPSCSCRKAKVTCTSKCHGGRGGNIYCQLCTTD